MKGHLKVKADRTAIEEVAHLRKEQTREAISRKQISHSARNAKTERDLIRNQVHPKGVRDLKKDLPSDCHTKENTIREKVRGHSMTKQVMSSLIN
jgi:hypothetical protein